MNQLLKALYAMGAMPVEPVISKSHTVEQSHEDRRGMGAAAIAPHGRRVSDLPDQARQNRQTNNRENH